MFTKLKSPNGVIVEVMPFQVSGFKARGFSEIQKPEETKKTEVKDSKK